MGFGALGDTGLGSCEPLIAAGNLPEVLVITFGKAVASSGACVLGTDAFIDYMVQFNRDYTYSTAMSPLNASHTLARIKTLRDANEKRATLKANIALFKRLANEHSIALMDSNTAIQPIVLGCAQQTLAACEHLKQQGIWLSAIRPPTVQHNTSRLRVTLTAAHTQQDIQTLITCFTKGHCMISPLAAVADKPSYAQAKCLSSNNLKDATQRKFSTAANSYAAHANVQKQAANDLFKLMTASNNAKQDYCIDLGAGPLVNTHALQELYRYVLAIDLSHTMLKSSNVDAPRICADMDNLPLQENSVDVVFSNFAVQWSANFETLMHALYKNVKTRGKGVYKRSG